MTRRFCVALALAAALASPCARSAIAEQPVAAPARPLASLPQGDDVRCLAFSGDGRLLALGCGGDDRAHNGPGQINLIDVAKRERVASLFGHPLLVESLAFSPDNRSLASGGDGRTVILWDLTTRNRKSRFRVGGDGKANEGAIQDYVWLLAFHPDSQTLVSADDRDLLRVWDTRDGREQAPLPVPENARIHSLRFDRNGRALLWTQRMFDPFNPEAVEVMLWDFAAGRALWKRRFDDYGLHSVSPSGKRLVCSSNHMREDGSLEPRDYRILDAISGTDIAHFSRTGLDAPWVAFSPDDALIALAGEARDRAQNDLPGPGVLRIWNASTGKLVSSLDASKSSLTYVAFSPDGKLVATADAGHDVRLWDLAKIVGD